MRSGRALAILAVCALLGACGTSPRDQVRGKIEQFARATARKDYKTLCDQVLAPSLIAHLKAYGIGCEQAMRVAFANVRSPALSIGQITVRGNRASVIALAIAAGQPGAIAAIDLVKTSGGWRVASLGSVLQNGSK